MHCHQGLVESALLQRDSRAPLAFQRKGIQLGPAEIFFRRNNVCGDAHIELGIESTQIFVARIQREWRCFAASIGHHLYAAGDDEVFHSGHDVCGGQIDCGNTAAAKAIQRYPGSSGRKARIQRCHTTDAGTLFLELATARHNDVVNLFGFEITAFG